MFKPARAAADISARGTRIVKVAINGETFEIRERVVRVPQSGDRDPAYEYDALMPGPIGDTAKFGHPKDTKNPVPSQGFLGGKCDSKVLTEDTVFYRVGDATREWGQWWTDVPLSSEAQYRIDVAVKREWSDPATGEVKAGYPRSAEEAVLWSYTARIPKGTTVYVGPVGSQGGVFMGGSSTLQYYIPSPWTLQSHGATIVAKEPFATSGKRKK